MKLPDILGNLLPKKQSQKELFASLLLDEEYVAAALWEIGDKGVPSILASDSKACGENNWEARIDAVDAVLATIENKAGVTDYSKVVLGLPLGYLTPTGEISKEIRPHMKQMTRELELTPIGFVSIHQALVYRLKKDEGVPPSVILLGISKESIGVSLYRVGILAGQETFTRSGDIAINVEEVLKQFKHLEVLPARILLYGSDGKYLEEIKSELMRYPWTTRVNFLHFPKIEIIKPEDVVAAVSLAGASELAREMGVEDEEVSPVPVAAPTVTEKVVEETSSGPDELAAEAVAKDIEQLDEEEITSPNISESVDEDTLTAQAEAEEVEVGEEIAAEEGESDAPIEEESNVVMVDPSDLGFRKNVDVLEEVETAQPEDSAAIEREKISTKRKFSFPAVSLAALPFLRTLRSKLPAGGAIPIIGIVAVIAIIIGVFYWFVPHVTVTILELPKAIEESQLVTIDPTATVVDAENKILPGAAQEKSVSGQKTIPVTGKKNIGDPAKGAITIYNKTLSAHTFSKGTELSNGSLKFTLDADVQVASASEDLNGRTFGKGTGAITASQIGPDSNLPANKTFSIKGFSTDEAVANNTQALAGGTSKQVTVVSRADYDDFLKAVSDDLVDKAKQELSAEVQGNEKLIDETIATSVTQKTFNQELDQEATELSGNATITVKGTSYNEDDVKTLLKAFIAKDVPAGYTLAEGRTHVTIENVKVLKDGKITAKATIKSDAVPTLDIASIRKNLAGKKLAEAESYLRSLAGIAGMEVHFNMSFDKSRLPMNTQNITVGVAIQ